MVALLFKKPVINYSPIFSMKPYGQKLSKSRLGIHASDHCGCETCNTYNWKKSKTTARKTAKQKISEEILDYEENIDTINDMKTNVKNTPKPIRTHEGAVAKRIKPLEELRRSVMACMLWENSFYESGVTIADRIKDLVAKVSGKEAMEIAIEARENMKLRHTPLYIARLMAQNPKQREYVADTLSRIIQRADELSEFLSIYWKEGKCPIANQVKKGLATAFTKFDEYALAKYNRDGAVKLKDVLFMVHARPNSKAQEDLWKRLVNDELKTPDTWEVELSASKDKKASWTRLLNEKKLGALALLRNLRNMEQAGVNEKLIRESLVNMKTDRVLPFRFISAARNAPKYEAELEESMLKSLDKHEKLSGKTIILVDISVSMHSKVSGKSDISRLDAACGVAMLLREICSTVEVHSFSYETKLVPSRRGFALAEAISKSQKHQGTYLGESVKKMNLRSGDRLIVITDEQSADRVPDPVFDKAYMINVASYRNGVGYGKWTHVDGWSESVVDYIIALEKDQ